MRFSPDLLRRCWFLAGPTACGKSRVALALAERRDRDHGESFEIVSLDSMTLYRRLNIGTAKPSAAECARVPHHLFDVLEPSQEFSVAEYLAAAESVCREIVARGGTPLFVGGTGLYLRSLLRGVFAGPSANDELRQRLEAEATRDGIDALHRRLQQFDPLTAARVHPHDLRRVVRALEVLELTGQPLSAQHREEPLAPDQRPSHVFWLSPPRGWLYDRINARVEQMLAAGWLEEVRSLVAEPQPLSQTARQALGYQELIEHLRGERSLAETVVRIQTRTRQFAKRQHTWFRNLEECQPLPITGNESAAELADQLMMGPIQDKGGCCGDLGTGEFRQRCGSRSFVRDDSRVGGGD
ncbi:MAG: tRNA (adenosine(37)-N6)-dimethylallyltransferase MiaA [Planctomycetaceae bacterium]